MKRFIAALAMVAALTGCTTAEDDPGFDCATMGNGSCVPEAFEVTRHDGTVMIVTPDGVLLIVPLDGSCVRIARGETDNAPCLPEE